MGWGATVLTIAAGATPVLTVPAGGNQRPRHVVVQNITGLGSLAAVGFGSATQTPSSMFFLAGTTAMTFDTRQGQSLYAVHNSAAAQTLSILMDLL